MNDGAVFIWWSLIEANELRACEDACEDTTEEKSVDSNVLYYVKVFGMTFSQ